MAKELEKVRTGFYIEKEVLDRCDELLEQANVKSRNEFVTELSKLSHVVAYTHAVDEQALQSLHLKCVEEVKRINGAVDFEDAYNYQKRRT